MRRSHINFHYIRCINIDSQGGRKIMKWNVIFKFYKDQGLSEYVVVVDADSHGEASRMIPKIKQEEGITRHKGNAEVRPHKAYGID